MHIYTFYPGRATAITHSPTNSIGKLCSNMQGLTREHIIQDGFAHAPRQTLLMNPLHALLEKQAVEQVQNPKCYDFCIRIFLVPMPNNNGGQFFIQVH